MTALDLTSRATRSGPQGSYVHTAFERFVAISANLARA